MPGLWALWVLIGAALAHSCHKKTGDPLECPVCGEFSGTPHRRPPMEPKTTRRGPHASDTWAMLTVHLHHADSMRRWATCLAAWLSETSPLVAPLTLKLTLWLTCCIRDVEGGQKRTPSQLEPKWRPRTGATQLSCGSPCPTLPPMFGRRSLLPLCFAPLILSSK